MAGGPSVAEVCRKLEVSPPTCHRWRQEDGVAKEESVKRLKELEKENGRRKKLEAELLLDKAILKELAEGAEWNETAKGAAPLPAGQHRRVLAKWPARRANAKRSGTSGKSANGTPRISALSWSFVPPGWMTYCACGWMEHHGATW